MTFLPGGGSGKVRSDDVERPVSLAALIAKIKQGSAPVQIYERPNLSTVINIFGSLLHLNNQILNIQYSNS